MSYPIREMERRKVEKVYKEVFTEDIIDDDDNVIGGYRPAI